MNRFREWGCRTVFLLAFLVGAEGVLAGDPIVFYSIAQLKSAPLKRVDVELVRAQEALERPIPTDDNYSPMARRAREARRREAQKRAVMQRRERSSSKKNWLVGDESAKKNGEEEEDESLRALGGEASEDEMGLLGPDDSDLTLDLSDLAEEAPRGGNEDRSRMQRVQVQRSRTENYSRQAAPSQSTELPELNLTTELDLKSLMSSESQGSLSGGATRELRPRSESTGSVGGRSLFGGASSLLPQPALPAVGVGSTLLGPSPAQGTPGRSMSQPGGLGFGGGSPSAVMPPGSGMGRFGAENPTRFNGLDFMNQRRTASPRLTRPEDRRRLGR